MSQEHEVNGDGQTMDLSAWETPADQVDLTQPERTPIPEGVYTLMIANICERTGKDSGVPYHEVTLEIVEGERQGRKHWERLFFNSDNENARNYAKQKLACLRLAAGLPRGLPNELINKIVKAKIGISAKKDNQGNAQNEIKEWFDPNGSSLNKSKSGPGSTPTPQRGAGAPARPAVSPGQGANPNGRAAPAGGPGGAPKQFVPPRVGGPRPMAPAGAAR
jgi:hypothetical protein